MSWEGELGVGTAAAALQPYCPVRMPAGERLPTLCLCTRLPLRRSKANYIVSICRQQD